MKKRIVCVLLTLIMLMSVLPVSVSAASMKVSEAAITVLKQLEGGFKSQCWFVEDNHQNENVAGTEGDYYTGYGTICTRAHDTNNNHVDGNKRATTQAEADTALRKVLSDLDAKVNAFASSNGLSLNQGQHDALVVFSYDAGSGWTTGAGVIRTAVTSGAGTNEMLNALNNWANSTLGNSNNMSRRMVEVNMYMNGTYSNTVSYNFKTVTYNANSGTIPQNQGTEYTMYFDISDAVAHEVVPTKTNYKFLGWYEMATVNGKSVAVKRYPNLNAECAEKTLYALWQHIDVAKDGVYTDAAPVSYTIKASSLIEPYKYYTPEDGKHNLLSGMWKITETELPVYYEYIDANGTRWGGVNAKGTRWVKLALGTGATVVTPVGTSCDVNVTVTNSYVRSRKNASITSAQNGTYSQGDVLHIINYKNGSDGFLWGQVENGGKAVGWVALMYTNWESVYGATSNNTTVNESVIATATVTYNGYLNIRAEAGTDAKIVGALAKNDTVDLYEMKTHNGHQWGRCKSGWICLSYTSINNFGASDIITDEGASAYMFTGTLNAGTVLYEDVILNGDTNKAQVYHEALTEATNAKVLQLKADNNGDTWFKVLWYVDNDNNGTYETPLYGWVKKAEMGWFDPAKYTVVCEQLNVRATPNNAADSVFKLTKGVQVTISEVELVGENIWGKADAHNGWINLASKYVSRGDVVTNEQTTPAETGLIATVINTDAVNVRKTGATYGQIIGKLTRGTTAAVLEEKNGWYNLDVDVDDNPKTGTWVSGSYLDVQKGTVNNSTVTDSNGNSYQTDGTGTGIVANTYSGVNVRTGAGTGYGTNGKLLPGTVVEILEVKTVGATKWGRVAQGWISMNYVTMMTYNELETPVEDTLPEGGVSVDSYEEAERTSTTAVYTGTLINNKYIFSEPSLSATETRTAAAGEKLTIYELAAVTETKTVPNPGSQYDGVTDTNTETTTVTKTTTYWARVNDGWIVDPEQNIELDALDEKVHTVTGSNSLNVRTGAGTSNTSIAKLEKGDKVIVTSLVIEKDKVWGRIEMEDGTIGWSRLDYMSEGALYEKEEVEETTPVVDNTTNNTTNNVVLGNGSSVGGYVTNSRGYRYTGKVIRTNALSVRATPSTSATKTTTLKSGQAMVIYETTLSENMAWGRCDAGWVYLYYVDLVPVTGAVDARVVANENTIIYSDMNGSAVAGTYARQSVIDIYEIVGKMARTELGWVSTDNLL